jgi:hypothetical protein
MDEWNALMNKRSKFEKIGFIGDIHCGSYEGLWPKDLVPSKHNRYTSTRYLNECFDHLVNSWPDLDLLVLMGDLVDGQQHKSQGTGLYTTDLSEQTEGAIEVIRPLAKKAKAIIRVWGTPYHEGFQGTLKRFDKEFDVKVVKQVLNIRLRPDSVLNVAHHPSGNSAFYRGTQLDREAVWAAVAMQERKIPQNIRWIVRAHMHFYGYQETNSRAVAVVPCFQMPTAHAIKTNYFRFQPDIGAMIMHADDTHPFGYRMTPHLYDVPTPKVYDPEEIL